MGNAGDAIETELGAARWGGGRAARGGGHAALWSDERARASAQRRVAPGGSERIKGRAARGAVRRGLAAGDWQVGARRGLASERARATQASDSDSDRNSGRETLSAVMRAAMLAAMRRAGAATSRCCGR
jgi:hypothetical protein